MHDTDSSDKATVTHLVAGYLPPTEPSPPVPVNLAFVRHLRATLKPRDTLREP